MPLNGNIAFLLSHGLKIFQRIFYKSKNLQKCVYSECDIMASLCCVMAHSNWLIAYITEARWQVTTTAHY